MLTRLTSRLNYLLKKNQTQTPISEFGLYSDMSYIWFSRGICYQKTLHGPLSTVS